MKKWLVVFNCFCALFSVFAEEISWTGADATNPYLWSSPANWSTGAVPTENDDVFVFDANLVTNNTLTAVHNLVIKNSKIVLAKKGITSRWSINGKLELKEGSVITCALSTYKVTNPTIYPINITVNGADGIYIDSTSQITTSALGFEKNGNGSPSNGYVGAAYGGMGGHLLNYGVATLWTNSDCYGDIRQPGDLGSAGIWSNAESGGLITLFAPNGNITLDGVLSSDGRVKGYTGPGSGGSVLVSAKNLLGSGTVSALGGDYVSGPEAGGSGRIAIYQTEGAKWNEAIKLRCYPFHTNANRISSGPGTIYIENAGDNGEGELIVDSNNFISRDTFTDMKGVLKDLVPYLACRIANNVTGIDVPFKKLTIKNKARFTVVPGKTIYIRKLDATTAAAIRANIYIGNGPEDPRKTEVTSLYDTDVCSALGGTSYGDIYILKKYGLSVQVR